MPQIVETPDGEFEFPDDFDQERIRQELVKHYASQPNNPVEQSMLTQPEREAVLAGRGGVAKEEGATGALGYSYQFLRGLGGDLMGGLASIAENVTRSPIDDIAKLQEAERVVVEAKKRGAEATLPEIETAMRNQPVMARELESQIIGGLPVDQSVQDSFGGQVARGFGQVAGTMLSAAATRGAPQVSTLINAAGQMMNESQQQAEQAALAKGMAKEQAEDKGREAATSVGLMKAVPEYLLDRMVVGKMLQPYAGSGLTLRQAGSEVAKSLVKSAPVGGATEAAQQAMDNLFVSQNINPNQPLTSGLIDSLLVGGVVQGGAMGAATTIQSAATLASPENRAANLANRIDQQARVVSSAPDALRLAANLPADSRQESYTIKSDASGRNTTEATYTKPDGRRVTISVKDNETPQSRDNPLLLMPPQTQQPQGQGTPVPVGEKVVPRMDRQSRQVVNETTPVTGPVIATPPPVNPDDLVRLDMYDITNGDETFIEGVVLPDKSGVRITYIPPSLEGSSQQLRDASTPRGTPVKQPKLGEVVPISVAERDFRIYGFRPQGAWYSNMAAPRPPASPAVASPQAQEAAQPTISQVQSNRQTLAQATQIGSVMPAQPEQVGPRPYFPEVPDNMQLPRQEPAKPQPSFGKRRATNNEKRIIGEGRPYFPTAPDRMQYSFRVPTQQQAVEGARRGEALRDSLRRVAPKGAAELDVLLGQRPSNVDPSATAAYDPANRLIYLSDKIATFPEQVAEYTHEAGHAFWDTLPDGVKLSAASLYEQELRSRSGPLFGSNGNLREGISPRIASPQRAAQSSPEWDTLGLREWFAERIMSENADWALGRANTTSLLGRAANAFRTAFQSIGSALGKGDAINNAFKSWASFGPRYGITPDGGEVASSMRDSITEATKQARDDEPRDYQVDDAAEVPLNERFSPLSDDIRYSRRSSDDVYVGMLKTPVNDAVASLKVALEENEQKFHKDFLEQAWPKALKDAGQKTLPLTEKNLRLFAQQGVSDLLSFASKNYYFANYYDTDLKLGDMLLGQAFPQVGQDPSKALAFRLYAAATSSGTSLGRNMTEAVNVFDLWLREPSLDSIVIGRKGKSDTIKSSPFTFAAGTGPQKARAVKVVASVISKYGHRGAADFMQKTQTLTEINRLNRQLGYTGGVDGPAIRAIVMEATGQDKQIPNAFVFGPKVGAYMMNWLGDTRYNTIDIWESRLFRSYFPAAFRRVLSVGKDGEKVLNTGLAQGSERAAAAKFSGIFNAQFERITGLRLQPSALQALRWFYIIDSMARAGYRGANTSESSSEYTRRALAKRGLIDESDPRYRGQVNEDRGQPQFLKAFSGSISYREGSGEGFGRGLRVAGSAYDLAPISAEEFSAIAAANKSAHPFGTSVDVLSAEKYQGYNLVVANWKGESATISVAPDGEVGAVTKSPNAPPTLVRVAMEAAINASGNKGLWLSAFETVLPDAYADYGFQPVAKMRFNDEFKPEGWDYARYRKFNSGRPDVVFMRYMDEYQKYSELKDRIPVIDDYDLGVKMAKEGDAQSSLRGAQEVSGRVVQASPPAGMSRPESSVPELRASAVTSLAGLGSMRPEQGGFWARQVRKHVNKFRDFEQFRKRLAEGGVNLAEDADFHTIEQNMHGVLGAKQEKLYDDHLEIIEQVRAANLGEPMTAAIGGQQITSTKMDMYLYAMHAPERNAHLLNTLGKQDGSGMSDAESAKILADLASDIPKLRLIAERIYAMNGSKLALMEEASLISKEARQAISERYVHYVPLLGKDGATEEESTPTSRMAGGMTMVGRDITSATGRYSAAADILAQTFVAQQRAIIRAERNKALLSLQRLASSYPQNGLVEPVDQLKSGETAESSNIITYKQNGENRYIRVTQDWLEASFKDSAGRTIQLVDGIGRATRFIASLATTYNPLFPIPNFTRDTIAAMLNLSGTELEGGEVDLVKRVGPSLRAVFVAESPAFRKGERPSNLSARTSRLIQYYEEFKKSGGQMIFLGLRDVDYYAKQVQGITQSSGTDLQKVSRITTRVYSDIMEYINLGFENANRLAVYSLARDRGMTPTKAANIARNLTTNFTMRGQMSGPISKLFMFFQASVNGTYRVAQSLATPRGAAVAAGIFTTAFLQRIIARAIDEEDKKAGVKQLEVVPEYALATNIVQPLPMSDAYLKLPIPYTYNILWYAGVKAADAMPRELGGRGENPMLAAGKIIQMAVTTLNPLGGGQYLVDSIIPSPLQPFSEIRYNRNFAGQPIYPEDNPFDSSPDPYAFRHWSNVNPTLRDTMEGIARITGGNEVRPSLFEKGLGIVGMEALASPESVNYLFRGIFGGPYSMVNDVSRTLSGAAKGNVSLNSLPIVRRFVGQADDKSYGMLYKDVLVASAMSHEEMRIAQKRGDREALARLKSEQGAEIASYQDISRVEYILKQKRVAAKAAEASGNSERADAIREEVVQIQKAALLRYYQRVDEFK